MFICVIDSLLAIVVFFTGRWSTSQIYIRGTMAFIFIFTSGILMYRRFDWTIFSFFLKQFRVLLLIFAIILILGVDVYEELIHDFDGNESIIKFMDGIVYTFGIVILTMLDGMVMSGWVSIFISIAGISFTIYNVFGVTFFWKETRIATLLRKIAYAEVMTLLSTTMILNCRDYHHERFHLVVERSKRATFFDEVDGNLSVFLLEYVGEEREGEIDVVEIFCVLCLRFFFAEMRRRWERWKKLKW